MAELTEATRVTDTGRKDVTLWISPTSTAGIGRDSWLAEVASRWGGGWHWYLEYHNYRAALANPRYETEEYSGYEATFADAKAAAEAALRLVRHVL